MQVGLHRIRGTASAEFMATDAASQLAAASEQDLTAALAQLRLNQQQQAAAAAAANGYGSAPGCVTYVKQLCKSLISIAAPGSVCGTGKLPRQSSVVPHPAPLSLPKGVGCIVWLTCSIGSRFRCSPMHMVPPRRSGVSTRQTSHDFSSVATFSGTASVGRGSQDYGGQPGSGGAPQQLGGAGGSGLNLAAGSDIYTVLANIQRNSAAAAQQQQQQRMSPQPASHMVRLGY